MKFLTAFSIAALSSCSLAAVTMNIARSSGPANVKRGLKSRSTITESLGNNATGQSYMATVTVGSAGQTISLAIDTGSSDTWLLSTTTDLCTDTLLQEEEETGCETPFNSKNSNTFKVVDEGAFHITYGDGSGVDGDYITDDLTIGGATVKSLEMGFAVSANLTQGLLAVGYPLNEASEGDDQPFTYPNIIDSMVSQGLIATKAYSLYLNDLQASTGSIIFGGLDTGKFHGDLVKMPIVPAAKFRNGTDVFLDFSVAVTSMSLNKQSLTISSGFGSSSGESAGSFNAVLDSGTSITLLPEDVAQQIYDTLGAVIDNESFESSGLALVDCELTAKNPDATFDFGFGGSNGSITISIPYSEMIIPPAQLGFNIVKPSGVTFSEVCVLGLVDVPDAPFILGDTFLRSAYVVYDLQNNEISLGQTNFNSSVTNVVDFTAGESSIPQATGTTVTPTGSGSQSTSSGTSTSGSGTGSGSGSGTESSSPSTGTSTTTSSGTEAPTSSTTSSTTSGTGESPPGTGTSTSGPTSSSTDTSTGTHNAAPGSSVPPFKWTAVLVLCGSTALAILGGSLLYA